MLRCLGIGRGSLGERGQDEVNKKEKSTLDIVATHVEYLRTASMQTNKKLAQIEVHLSKQNGTIQKHETTLYGDKSDKGLCGWVEDNANNIESNSKNIAKLMIVVAVIAAGIGFGGSEIVHLFGG